MSEHAFPLATFACWHARIGSQLSVVQAFRSSQFCGADPTQTPPKHVSTVVQTDPSLQPVKPSSVGACLHNPVPVSQLSAVQVLLSSQFVVAPGAQLPFWQMSPTVHALPSLHAAVVLACWQALTGSQLSIVHGLPSSQFSGVSATQMPDLHVSLGVQFVLSALQVVPSHGVGSNTQLPVVVLQLSVVQLLPSSQVFTAPGWQAPSEHVSPTVHALPSLQASALLLWVQPLTGSHASAVQGFRSSQLSAAPALQIPPRQASPGVHTLLSALHGLVSARDAVTHLPLVGSQAVALHWPSCVVSHVTIDPALILQKYSAAALSQYSVPVQRFGLGAQSLSEPHWQMFWPLTHTPLLLQVSFCVHGL